MPARSKLDRGAARYRTLNCFYHRKITISAAAILYFCGCCYTAREMLNHHVFEQSIAIQTSAAVVEQCLTDLVLMHQWLNPALRCEPIGVWSTDLGSRSQFTIRTPVWSPSLQSTVVEREPGLIVWQFEGFFQGQDRWECRPVATGTVLLNRFEFEIPNPLVNLGFNWLAANWTQKDMQAQLKRLKQVAESLVNCG